MGAFALAFVAGFVSFASPCCLPLMPGYVSYVSGVAGSSERTGSLAVRTRVLGSAALFVVGFATVFAALGASASAFGSVLLANRLFLIRVAGAFVIAMGLITMGLVRIQLLAREARFDLRRIRPGPLGAYPLGMAFAIGWTPCIGPVLAGILATAATVGGAVWGATLLFTYALGLGIPFLLLALLYARAGGVFRWLRRHGRAIEIVGGGVLVLMGVLMIAGRWLLLFTPVIRFFTSRGWPPI
jgi:cytochrome c-type biogenesis protein